PFIPGFTSANIVTGIYTSFGSGTSRSVKYLGEKLGAAVNIWLPILSFTLSNTAVLKGVVYTCNLRLRSVESMPWDLRSNTPRTTSLVICVSETCTSRASGEEAFILAEIV